jgi:hypothetical protein
VADAVNPKGNELSFWSKHISKLAWHGKVNNDWSVSNSMIYYWGFDGINNFSQWVTENTGDVLPSGAHRRYGLYDGSNLQA